MRDTGWYPSSSECRRRESAGPCTDWNCEKAMPAFMFDIVRKGGVHAERRPSTWVTVLSRGAASDAHGSTGKPEPAFQSAESELPVQDRLYPGRAPFGASPGS